MSKDVAAAKSPPNKEGSKSGASGTRTGDLLGPIRPLGANTGALKAAISRTFAMLPERVAYRG
jgi:hypothetical protein